MTKPTKPPKDDKAPSVMRQTYRALTDAEKAAMQKVKDDAEDLHDLFASFGNSRELSVAKTKIEEAVMWAVKHITGTGIGGGDVTTQSGGGPTTPPKPPKPDDDGSGG